MSSCQEQDRTDSPGYLCLEVETNAFTNPQSRIVDEYNPKQIAVRILDKDNTVVAETDDHTMWKDRLFRLQPGNYTVKASSSGFDGSESGFDTPYYAGSGQVFIETNTTKTVTVRCTLANVKVTVNYDRSFTDAFRSATSTVSSKLAGVSPLTFKMGGDGKSGYFPVGDLSAAVKVVNKSNGREFSLSREITGVKARDHYILNYRVADSGGSNVTVSTDDTQKTYTFTFNVSTEATTRLVVSHANAWSGFACLEGEIASAVKELDPSKMTFEYKPAAATEWGSIPAIQESGKFRATAKGLEPNAQYVYRMVYRKDGDEFSSDQVSFTTETATPLYNGNMDLWYKSGKTWYPSGGEDEFFWDTSNPGTTTGAGALVNVNPTQGNSSVVHTSGGRSAELKSQYASAFGIGKFAAASLYSGRFNSLVGTDGAKIDFGQPFTSRPTRLRGFFQYSTGAMDHVGKNIPTGLGIVKDETPDVCSIYIALTTRTYQVDNTDTSTFIDFDNDPGIVAYGSLPLSECAATGGEWREFAIDLKYHSLTTRPTHIIVVCSSSRYGDYFTGSTKSLMYVDDLELVYGDNPIVK